MIFFEQCSHVLLKIIEGFIRQLQFRDRERRVVLTLRLNGLFEVRLVLLQDIHEVERDEVHFFIVRRTVPVCFADLITARVQGIDFFLDFSDALDGDDFQQLIVHHRIDLPV